jgi:hypothetical protein
MIYIPWLSHSVCSGTYASSTNDMLFFSSIGKGRRTTESSASEESYDSSYDESWEDESSYD